MKGRRIVGLLLCLGLAMGLAGCWVKTSQLEDKQRESFVYGPEADIVSLTAAETAELAEGETVEVAVTPELREAFFELGRLARWDFMHKWMFAEGEEPASEDMEDYIYFIGAQSLVWADYWNIDHDKPSTKLSISYVDEFMRLHFGRTVPHWTKGQKEMAFDGQNYMPIGSWAYQPLYRLLGLEISREEIDGESRLVYEATLRLYGFWPEAGQEDIPDDVISEGRELLCANEEPQLPAGYYVTKRASEEIQQVRFYLNEVQEGGYIIRYLNKQNFEE